MARPRNPLNTKPRSVAIIGLGPSAQVYLAHAAKKVDFLEVDEVWVCNSAYEVLCADKAFMMDDFGDIVHRYPQWAAKLKLGKTPIISCSKHEDFPHVWEYPRDAVLEFLKDDWLSTTPAYMVAYAMYIGVRSMYLYGIDYNYPGGMAVESGADCVAHLLGMAKVMKIDYKIPQESTLCDANLTQFAKPDEKGRLRRPLYGYDYNPGDSAAAVERGTGSPLDRAVANKRPMVVTDPKMFSNLKQV